MTGERRSTSWASNRSGISRDSPWTHIAWTQALDLNFGLLSDWNAEAIHGFGIGDRVPRLPGRRRHARRSSSTADGLIRNAWSYDTGEVPDVEEWLEACRALS